MTAVGHRPFRTLCQVEQLVHDFECGRLPAKNWDHRAHLTVAAWYLTRLPECEATERFIRGIRRYNHAAGIVQSPTGGYHETITLFWLVTVRVSLDTLGTGPSVLEKINQVVEWLSDEQNLIFQYYDRPRLFSDEARARWVPPNRLPRWEPFGVSSALGMTTDQVGADA